MRPLRRRRGLEAPRPLPRRRGLEARDSRLLSGRVVLSLVDLGSGDDGPRQRRQQDRSGPDPRKRAHVVYRF